MKKVILLLIGACLEQSGISQVKILFDATKAESAANADWVIDADLHNMGWNPGASVGGGNESNAQKIPTPAQSGITSSTPETFWAGSLSNWGVDCAKKGYIVESLPYNGQITYGNTSNMQDLSNYKVFIVDEPNILFTSAEKIALMNFIQNGGGLFLISDHTVSDRNNDGNDSPMIWNDFITNNGVHNNPFGFSFDLQNFSQTSTNVATLPGDSALHGPMGTVTEVQWSNGTSMTLVPSQNSSVKGVVYKTGASNTGTTNALCVYARYGCGKVAAIGDSSPPDDGTGDPNDNSLYNGYITDAAGNHQKLLMNLTIWLAEGTCNTTEIQTNNHVNEVWLFPNPTSTKAIIQFANTSLNNSTLTILNINGEEVKPLMTHNRNRGNEQYELDTTDLPAGIYYCKVNINSNVIAKKLVVLK